MGKNGENKAKMSFFEYSRSNFSEIRLFPKIRTLLHYRVHRVLTKMAHSRKIVGRVIAMLKNIRIARKISMGLGGNDFKFSLKTSRTKVLSFFFRKTKNLVTSYSILEKI